MLSEKQLYRQWSLHNGMPFFMQAWWMDAVCSQGKTWDVILHKSHQEIDGVLVYHEIKKFGFRMVLQPELTPYSGWWVSPHLSEEEKQAIAQDLLCQLLHKRHHYIQIAFPPQAQWTDILKKYGFSLSLRPTYILNDIDREDLLSSFHLSKRRHIKKAETRLQYTTLPVEEFCRLHNSRYELQGKKDYYSQPLLQTVCRQALEHGQGVIGAVVDEGQVCHAAALVVYDADIACYLLYFIHPQYKASGASSMLVYELVRHLRGKTKHFDFEGGQEANVAASYSKFGTRQYTWILAEKYTSVLLRMLMKVYYRHLKR